jgi:hypothetical protein
VWWVVWVQGLVQAERALEMYVAEAQRVRDELGPLPQREEAEQEEEEASVAAARQQVC